MPTSWSSGCGCPQHEGIQSQVGQGFEEPGLKEVALFIAERLELDDLKSPSQTKTFYDSMIDKK